MARLVIELPENSPGCILFSLFSGPGVRLPELERHVNTRAGV